MDITGKPMRGLVWVGADEALEAGLHSWIELAMRFVAALPPKQFCTHCRRCMPMA